MKYYGQLQLIDAEIVAVAAGFRRFVPELCDAAVVFPLRMRLSTC